MNDYEQITRTILGNIPSALAIAFYVAAYAACGLAALVFIRRFLQYRRAAPSSPDRTIGSTLPARVGEVIRYLTFHQELLRDRRAGIAHLLVFYGFFILFIGTCLVFLEHDTPLHFFYGRFYLISSLIVDLGGLVFIAGLLMFLGRRMGQRSGRILREWWVTSMVGLLLAIAVSGFLLEGARIAFEMPQFEKWSVVGYAVATAMQFAGVEGVRTLGLHRFFWATHAIFCVAFFALLPWKFFGHMVYGAVSWATRTNRPVSQLPVAPLETQPPGASHWKDLTWNDLVQTDACTTCGRCNEVCPALAAGKPLRPREVVLGLRSAMDQKAVASGLEGPSREADLSFWIADDTVWSCTTCGACNDVCPVGIEVFNKIVDLRRGRVEAGHVPDAAEELFESSADRANPFGRPADQRLEWAAGINLPLANEEEPLDLLYWVGCAGAFDPDGQVVARSMIKILNRLGISYRILGKRECCTGDPARRMGEEGLFRDLAARNIDTFDRFSVQRVLTSCPHCFNTFKNEYPSLGATFQVEHHSEFLSRMITEGKLRLPEKTSQSITFHDPCYLGRGNGLTGPPREVLGAVSTENLEMEQHGRSSFCCGAGGGAMWLDIAGKTRVENLRAQQAAETGASTLATACPFCKSMLQAGQQSLESAGKSMQGKDLAEVIVEAKGW